MAVKLMQNGRPKFIYEGVSFPPGQAVELPEGYRQIAIDNLVDSGFTLLDEGTTDPPPEGSMDYQRRTAGTPPVPKEMPAREVLKDALKRGRGKE